MDYVFPAEASFLTFGNMLTTKLTDPENCKDILQTILDIDCKLTSVSKDIYNNLVFALKDKTDPELIGDLLHYKRILTYRYCNKDYAPGVCLEEILSKVKLLIHK